MTTTAIPPEIASYADALDFSAPYLIEKLVNNHVVDTASDAQELFTEVKRYLVMTQLDPAVSWQMYSLRVDEVWHQFVLYTQRYAAFCEHYFGHMLHHRPNNAPAPAHDTAPSASTFRAFRARYRELFGNDLPDCWFDERSVSLARRVITTKPLRASATGDRVELRDETGAVVFSVDALATEAVGFIAGTGAFYVRELPGELTDDERIAIIATLVGQRLLRVAP